MKSFTYIFVLFFIIVACNENNTIIDTSNLLGNDYRLFEGTPLWDLAKAVRDENIEKIKTIITEQKVEINYQEPKYGKSLLMLAVLNEHYNSCKSLLELGADPNLYEKTKGSSAIIYAAAVNNTEDDNTKFLKLLLSHGANPNDLEVGERKNGNTTRMTPLLVACRSVNKIISPKAKVEILVNAGADINYKNEYNSTPLNDAYIHENLDVVIYLLKKEANFKIPLFNRDGKDIYLWDDLRDLTYPLDSKEYKQKMEIVSFLKKQGIDYKKISIPSYIITEAKETYPENWKEYLDKY